jgi:HD-GYP domain-containing protein (c-di-GMP phosphodiesterase class II)
LRTRLLCAVALVALGVGLASYLTGVLAGVENDSTDVRFDLRPATHPKNLLIVGIDENTLNTLQLRWPFPRSLDARAIDVLHADHARTIVYDVQFTQPTSPTQDLTLYEAVARAPGVILATSETGANGETSVLGGNANLAKAHAQAAAANFRANSSGIIQKYAYSIDGLKTIAVASAEQASGRRISQRDFDHGSAWIDYPGPPGTVPAVSFSSLVDGQVKPAQVAGKIVVIGATSPVLQDIHATSVSSTKGMSGPEVQAAAILTALDGNPLRGAPVWLALLTIVIAAIATPLSCMKMRATRALLLGVCCIGAYALLAQLAFDHGLIVVVTYPLIAAALGSIGALVVCYLAESWEHEFANRYGITLEATVRERTAELQSTQLGVIRRLAQAAELRDENTGHHIERVGTVCELLALGVGMSAEDAERLRIASALHDVGKIGLPDRILLKSGPLDDPERELMKTHTLTGSTLLAGSDSLLLMLAETIARTHHERWDGSGYPNGLRGDEIPLAGRICAVADVFDALSSSRLYKDSWSFDRVFAEIMRGRATQFDPALVDAFVAIEPELREAHHLAAADPLFAEANDATVVNSTVLPLSLPESSTPVGDRNDRATAA